MALLDTRGLEVVNKSTSIRWSSLHLQDTFLHSSSQEECYSRGSQVEDRSPRGAHLAGSHPATVFQSGYIVVDDGQDIERGRSDIANTVRHYSMRDVLADPNT